MPFQKGQAPPNKGQRMTTQPAPISPENPTLAASVDIAALIRAAVAEATAPMQEEITRLRSAQPTFIRAKAEPRREEPTYTPPEDLTKKARQGLPAGESAGATARWYDTARGRATIPQQYRPIFRPGDRIRINPESPIWGQADKTWGEVLAQTNVTNHLGEGTILGTMGMTATWEPKYKVDMPGGLPEGYRESELLFA